MQQGSRVYIYQDPPLLGRQNEIANEANITNKNFLLILSQVNPPQLRIYMRHTLVCLRASAAGGL
jgi:hypothetical protein